MHPHNFSSQLKKLTYALDVNINTLFHFLFIPIIWIIVVIPISIGSSVCAEPYQDIGHDSILIEIMGFWHTDYLRRKLKKVHEANLDNLLLLVYEDVNLTADKLDEVTATVLYFVKKPVLKDVLASADELHQTLVSEADIE